MTLLCKYKKVFWAYDNHNPVLVDPYNPLIRYCSTGLFTPNLCKYPLALSFGFLNGETFRRVGMNGNGLILTPRLLLLTIGENLVSILPIQLFCQFNKF